MAKFLVLDRLDEDDLKVSKIVADDLQSAVKSVYKKALNDDRITSCGEITSEQSLSFDEDSVQHSPGDGGQYTLFVIAEDNEEGRAKIEEWLDGDEATYEDDE